MLLGAVTMPTTMRRRRGAAAGSLGRVDRLAHPVLIATAGLLALAVLLALSRTVTGGGDRGSPDLGPLTVRCSDAAWAAVDEVRSIGRLVEDWPPRVVDGRCVALLHLDGTAVELGARAAALLRESGYRVDVSPPDPVDGVVAVVATTDGDRTVVLRIAADGAMSVRVAPA